MKKNSFHFIGDTQWGENLETPHCISNSLLITHKTCDFYMSYNNTPLNSISHLNHHDAKDIVGKNAQFLIICIGWVDICSQETFSQNIEHYDSLISNISHIHETSLFLCNQAVLSYKKAEQQEYAAELNNYFKKFESKNVTIIDYNDIFNQFHKDQSLYRNEPHALHYLGGRLTNLGSQLLAHSILLKLEKNSIFTPSLKENR